MHGCSFQCPALAGWWRVAGAVLLASSAAWLVGCVAYSPRNLPAGASVADVIAAMGAPTGEWSAAVGGDTDTDTGTGAPRAAAAARHLEFAHGPYGKHTYLVDFDAQGRMLTWHQALTDANFYAVKVGESQDAVRRRLGRPSTTFTIPRQQIAVWNYRYETPFCQWFQVSISTAPVTLGRVTEVGFGPDPICTSRY